MNKDAWLATMIGFGVGLVIAGMVFVGPSIFKNLPHFQFPKFTFFSNTKPLPTAKPSAVTFSIDSPLPDSIESKNETLVSGRTIANSIVVLEGENGEVVVSANKNGAYAGKLSLGEGRNILKVTSYKDTKAQILTVTVFYTPENF